MMIICVAHVHLWNEKKHFKNRYKKKRSIKASNRKLLNVEENARFGRYITISDIKFVQWTAAENYYINSIG